VAAYRATSVHANQISENRLLKRITDWADWPTQLLQNIHNIYTKSTQKLIVTKQRPIGRNLLSEQKLEVQNIIKLAIKPSSEVYRKSNQNW